MDLTYDLAHLLAGGMVLVSFMLLYQDRMFALLNVFALHAAVLALSVTWQAYVQHAPHLYVTADARAGAQGAADTDGVAAHRASARHSPRGRDRRSASA